MALQDEIRRVINAGLLNRKWTIQNLIANQNYLKKENGEPYATSTIETLPNNQSDSLRGLNLGIGNHVNNGLPILFYRVGITADEQVIFSLPEHVNQGDHELNLNIGGITLSKNAGSKTVNASISFISQDDFEKALSDVLKWLLANGISDIYFESGRNLFLPEWFIDQCKLDGVRVFVSPSLSIPVFNPSSFVQDFVTYVNRDPYHPTYRGKPHGKTIVGWSNRLNNYFWPNPAINLATTLTTLTCINAPASGFMSAIHHFPPTSHGNLVNWANDIFKWGGVPQVFTYSDVLDVLSSVNAGFKIKSARMNSGWTKVASFASEVLPPDKHLVIWDSRVAHSLVTRFETMLSSVGFSGLPVELEGIGYVRGRGGSRKGYPYNTTRWRNGYGRWDTVFKGSELVRLIRDELNSRSGIGIDFKCPVNNGLWTVRLVEMVLFMDGY